jgi:hypothetical protein
MQVRGSTFPHASTSRWHEDFAREGVNIYLSELTVSAAERADRFDAQQIDEGRETDAPRADGFVRSVRR